MAWRVTPNAGTSSSCVWHGSLWSYASNLTLERRELSIYKMTAFRQYRYNTHIYAGSEGGGWGATKMIN